MSSTTRALAVLALLLMFGAAIWISTRSSSDRPGDAAVVAPLPEGEEDRVEANLSAPGDGRVPVEVDPAPSVPAAEDQPAVAAEVAPVAPGLQLAGRVTMIDGVGLSLVQVRIEDTGASTVSAGGGGFSFKDVPAGEHRFAVGATGGEPGFEILGGDTFAAGDESIELVVRASLVRVQAVDDDGRRVSFRSVETTVVGPDGTAGPVAGRFLGGSTESTDLAAAAGVTLRIVASGRAGRYVGLIQTPVEGGAVAAVLRSDSPSLAAVEVLVNGPVQEATHAKLLVELDNTDRDDQVFGEFELGERILVTGLLSGNHRLRFALQQPQGVGASSTFAVVEAPDSVVVPATGHVPIAIEIAEAGLLDVQLGGDLSGIPPQALPAVVDVDLIRSGEDRALDVRWHGWLGGGSQSRLHIGQGWLVDRGLLPGDYTVRLESVLFETHEEVLSIAPGALAELNVELIRK